MIHPKNMFTPLQSFAILLVRSQRSDSDSKFSHSIREASTAILVANMPMCWSLMRHLFNLRSFNGSSSATRSKNTNPRSVTTGLGSKSHPKKALSSNIEGSRAERGETSWWEREGMRSDSEEYIVMKPTRATMPLEIWESKQFDVVENGRSSNVVDDRNPGQNKTYIGAAGFQTQTVVTARKSESEGSTRS
jgi:hypothetical protein